MPFPIIALLSLVTWVYIEGLIALLETGDENDIIACLTPAPLFFGIIAIVFDFREGI